MTDDLVVLGVVGAPHGVRGEVRIKPYTDDPLSLKDYSPLLAADGRSFAVEAARAAKTVVVCRLKGVGSREAAEALKGLELGVPRGRLPEPDADEFYLDDLVGMSVRGPDGTVLGEVVAGHDFGAGDVLELRLDGAKGTVMIPFNEDAVPGIDTESGILTVDPLASGLAEGDDPEEEKAER